MCGSFSSSSPTGCTTCRRFEALPGPRQQRIAQETLDIYAPIAHRLGLNSLYRDLQDLAFRSTHPFRYRTLKKAVQAARGNRREVLGRILEAANKALPEAGVQGAQVRGREKSIYAIHTKMREKHLSFAQVLDIYGMRVIVDTVPQCYLALGALHTTFKPVPGRFKDYIAIPKSTATSRCTQRWLARSAHPSSFRFARTKWSALRSQA